MDHYPTLQKDGGHLVLGNVRLAHVVCNRVGYAKTHGIKHDKDRAKGAAAARHETADGLNGKARDIEGR